MAASTTSPRAPRSTIALLAAAGLPLLLALGFASWHWMRGREAPAALAPREVRAPEPPAASEPPVQREDAQVQAPPAKRTTRQVLEEHFGPDAAAAIALVEEKGGDPEAEREIPPWSEVAARIEDKILLSAEDRRKRKIGKQEWPADPAKEKAWIEYMFCGGAELPEAAFVDVLAVADQHNSRIFEVASECVEELALQIEANFRSGDFRSSPIVRLAPRGTPDGRPAFYTKGGSTMGWTYAMQVRQGQNPRLDELRRELPRLTQWRNDAIRAVLREHGIAYHHRIEWKMDGFD